MFSYFMWIGMALLFIGAFGIIVNDNKKSKEKPDIVKTEEEADAEHEKWRKDMDDSFASLDNTFKQFGLKFGQEKTVSVMDSLFLLADEHLKLKARVDKLEGGK